MVQMEGNDVAEDTAMDISPSRPVNIMTQAWVSELAQASANLRMLGLTVCVQLPAGCCDRLKAAAGLPSKAAASV